MSISPSYPNNLQNGTPADATQVMANFLQIQNDVNTNGAHNGANSDITSLTGLTTPLGIIYGGTGGITAAAALTALGAAPLASPTLTGVPIAPTAAPGTNTTQIATTAFVAASFASPTLTGVPIAPTAAPGTNTTQIATTAFVAASFAPLASPTFTGAPVAPTPAAGDSSTKLATTAFVQSGLAKAFVNFAGASGTINKAFNVSSVVRNSVGNYTINFSSPMADANYSITYGHQSPGGGAGVGIVQATPGVSSFSVVFSNSATGTLVDPTAAYFAVFD